MKRVRRSVRGKAVVAGRAKGAVLHATEPLSFWGGYDAATGRITDTRHPLAGRSAAGAVLAIPATRGSSTTTAVLLEAIRRETAPAALVTREVDSFLALACIVGEELYGCSPAVVAAGAAFDALANWGEAVVEDGAIERADRP